MQISTWKLPAALPVCSLFICISIVSDSPGIRLKKKEELNTGVQVQCKLALEAETDYILNSIWGTLLPVLVKFLAKMLACVGGA